MHVLCNMVFCFRRHWIIIKNTYTRSKTSASLSFVTVRGEGRWKAQGGEQGFLCVIASPPFPYLRCLTINVFICNGQRSSEIPCDQYALYVALYQCDYATVANVLVTDSVSLWCKITLTTGVLAFVLFYVSVIRHGGVVRRFLGSGKSTEGSTVTKLLTAPSFPTVDYYIKKLCLHWGKVNYSLLSVIHTRFI
jgi:hypothetical protein